MAGMVCSAIVEQAVSRGVSFVLGKREEKASQGHIMERLKMAANEMEHALERSRELPIRHISLLQRRKMIKRAHVEAMELLDKYKQQAVRAVEEDIGRGVKRARWNFGAKNMPITPSAALNMDGVRRFEWYADCAGKFVRDVESGCSLHHYTFCNPIVRHLFEGKTLRYSFNKRKQLRNFCIWPMCSDERGVEAVLEYCYADCTAPEKYFIVLLILRISESTDLVGVAIRCLQFLTSGFKLAAESAMGELTLVSNLQDIAYSYGHPRYMEQAQICRPDPACCKADRLGLCANNSVSSELTHKFPEQVIFFGFRCFVSSAVERSPRRSTVGRGWSPPLHLKVGFLPHDEVDGDTLNKFETIQKYGDASIQKVAMGLKSDFLLRPKHTKYEIGWYSKHGSAWFVLEKPSIQRAGVRAPSTRGRYKYNARAASAKR